ncbi:MULTISPECIES: thiol reductant ABC exporter subunit CydC [Xanthomonas]|uniref:Thiol reductant ABC exporter subunit CydC n=1 Tax=Xanthomonas phaseoli pv. dieffenbachiae TaxID=92828 RepID=A0A1V9HGP7_9XANT|nr:thiol reductant ABC exporter subunit CydC [Xanthomonas phaseoli]MBO9769573.1 thiol reductant ABC exporter subunit CydC [Xanthomonas phaseoli pv. dieffenbachiae]MBO9777783.1 thiol reductant ABC exporter subunit CydC [Xanthomonas phaseoli pv. dieffenbachiae]MBO9780256.1 thiol reductant ABC exporter subunit CydC [Xanthomonas phaseoli pv. dieffenbachiae]MBO9788812.1 thiol reductant ABC exporter subunit CydC [Xanthomonas phaseoli pv. dieffenbachiae]MBO9796101.1 thiol reductant ABC exporter subun
MSRSQPERLRDVFGLHAWRLLLSAGLVLVTMLAGVGLLGLSGSFLTAAALAGVAGMGAGFNFFSPSAGIRALTFARIVSRYAEKLIGHDATLRIARDLRVWFFRRALPLAPGRLSATRTGDLLARLMSDIGEVDGLSVRALAPLAALLGIWLGGVVAAALIYLPAACVLLVLGVLIGGLVPWQVARGGSQREQLRAQQRTDLRTQAFEGLEGAADLAAIDAQGAWLQRSDAAAAAVTGGDRIQRRRLITDNLLHALCGGLGLAGMLWLALGAAERGLIGAERAAGLVFLTMALLEVWAGAGLALQALQSARVAAGRLQAIVDQAPSVSDPARAIDAPRTGTLQLQQVSFAWPGSVRPVLHALDLTLAPGERIAISGDSGSGKSTLSALILRLWDPQAGQLRYAGIDLRHVAQAQWHQRIAWLPQNAPVFAGSVRDNLLIGDPAADDAALWRVLEQVRLGAWASANNGLDTWVGENGATLSAGQARRLALARALLRDAPILLLDEPTDGLDVDTADALLLDLAAALGERSLVMITHDALPPGVVQRHYRMREGKLELLDQDA